MGGLHHPAVGVKLLELVNRYKLGAENIEHKSSNTFRNCTLTSYIILTDNLFIVEHYESRFKTEKYILSIGFSLKERSSGVP